MPKIDNRFVYSKLASVCTKLVHVAQIYRVKRVFEFLLKFN